jgi:ADP-heptose:LPS heptosyltransferase
MASLLERLAPGSHVAVIRLRSLGDCVLTAPALDILKRARPDLRIAVVVENRFRAIFEGNPDIELLLEPGWKELRRWRPHLCLNLHGGSASARLTALSGAPWRAGFGHYRWPFLYNVLIPRAQEILGVERKVHTAEHLASAMFYVGAPRVEIPQARLFAAGHPAGRPYAVIHPVAAERAKTWPAAGFLIAASFLRDSFDIEPVFIAGLSDDLSPFREFRTMAGAPLREVKGLMQGASLFLGNDSGPAHIAAAFNVPVVVIFGPSDPDIWYPWRTASEVIRAKNGIESVTERQVLDALERLWVHA